MACGSCGERAAQSAKYPREITLSDGSTMTVSSAAQERTERARNQQQQREIARGQGYTVKRGT